MKTSDEWLIIGGGIGTVVLLFAVYNKSNKKGQYATPTGIIPSQTTSGQSSTAPTFSVPQQIFNPPVENISIGGTHFGGATYNFGSNLFPYFGYAVQSSGLSQVYNTINNLMHNNAQYQQQQNLMNQNYNATAGTFGPPWQQNMGLQYGGGSGLYSAVGG